MKWQDLKNYFSKTVIIFFGVAGLVLLLTDKSIWPTYYDLPYMGWAALVCALAILSFEVGPLRSPKVRPLQTALALILLLNGLGDLGLYQLYLHGFEFDKVIHFLSPLIATLALARAYGLLRAILIVIAAAIGWELFEYLADALIKTHLFGVYRHQIFRDTVMDFAMNVLGVTLASIWLKSRTKPATLS